MKIFNILLIGILAIFLVGCSTKQQPSVAQPTIITKTETKIVKTPIIYEVPTIKCEFSGKGGEPTIKLIKCLRLHKKALAFIREHNAEMKRKYKDILNNKEE